MSDVLLNCIVGNQRTTTNWYEILNLLIIKYIIIEKYILYYLM